MSIKGKMIVSESHLYQYSSTKENLNRKEFCVRYVKKIMVLQLRIKKKKKKTPAPWNSGSIGAWSSKWRPLFICIHIPNSYHWRAPKLDRQFNRGKRLWSLKAQKFTAEYEFLWPWEGPLNFRTRDVQQLWERGEGIRV